MSLKDAPVVKTSPRATSTDTPTVNTGSVPVKLTLLLAGSLTVLAGAIIAPSLPAMQAHFQETPNAGFLVRLLLTIPGLFIAISAPFAGILADRFGRKPLLLMALLLYGVAGTSGLHLNDLGSLLIGRAFLGLAVAGIMTTVTTLIADYYAGEERVRFLGLQSAFMGWGGAVYTSGGGYLASLHWRYPFAIYLASLLILPLSFLFLVERTRHTTPGQAGEAVVETEIPVLPIFRIYALTLLLQVAFYLIPVQLPFHLQQLLRANAQQSGIAIAVGTFTFATTSFFSPYLRRGMPLRQWAALAVALIGVGYLLTGVSPNYLSVLGSLVVSGIGFGLIIPQMNAHLASIAPPALRGRILGGLTTSVFLGQFLSPIVAAPFISWVGTGGTYLFASGLLMALALSLLLAGIGFRSFARES